MASNEETNAAGTDTRPPMLVESDYDSWKIRIHRKKLDSELVKRKQTYMLDTQSEIILSQGRTIQQRKEDLFDEYERFRAIGNESIHDYFVRFHKLVNDMKITQLNIPTHQMNTKFVNNLPAYWVVPKHVSHQPTTSSNTSSNSRTHATVHDGQIVTEPIQRKAPGNVGNTGTRGKKVICYNCREKETMLQTCKEQKRKWTLQYFKAKALLMES
ncbi:hypothetical protein Tco_0967909 [Tanacetum coccineum]